jgi:BTB/POZ domain-containing protein 13
MDNNVPPNSSDQHGLKRSPSSDSINNEETTSTSSSSSKRFLSSGQYLYQVLFLDGKGSDVKISSLGRTWNLHRLQLCMSPYFGCMFNGQWSESDQSSVEVHIVDPNITVESLNVTFGSMYKDDVDICSDNVVGVLATSTMFLLDGLADRCARLMKEEINLQSVMRFHAAGHLYSQPAAERTCMEWLEKHLTTLYTPELLRDIDVQVMSKLVSSNDLFVETDELTLYNLVRQWLFIQLVPDREASSDQELLTATNSLIQSKPDEWGATETGSFLGSDQGAPYVSVFKHVRLQHIVSDYLGVETIHADRIIPEDWLTTACAQQWVAKLKMEGNRDPGPRLTDGVDFWREAVRGGWVMNGSLSHWLGEAHCGDFALFLQKNKLLMTQGVPNHSGYQHHTICRITVESFDDAGRQVYRYDTGVQELQIYLYAMAETLATFNSPTGKVHIGYQLLVNTPPTSDRG